MIKYIFIISILIISCVVFSNEIIAGSAYSIIPDYTYNTGYDYFELGNIISKTKRYSYEIYPMAFEVGISDDTAGEQIYDMKYSLGNYDGMLINFGAFNIKSSVTDPTYYLNGTIFMESMMGYFTGAFFYKDGDTDFGWAYEQPVTETISYIYEKRNSMINRGYKFKMSTSFYYEEIEVDTENNYGLKDNKYKNFVYKFTF